MPKCSGTGRPTETAAWMLAGVQTPQRCRRVCGWHTSTPAQLCPPARSVGPRNMVPTRLQAQKRRKLATGVPAGPNRWKPARCERLGSKDPQPVIPWRQTQSACRLPVPVHTEPRLNTPRGPDHPGYLGLPRTGASWWSGPPTPAGPSRAASASRNDDRCRGCSSGSRGWAPPADPAPVDRKGVWIGGAQGVAGPAVHQRSEGARTGGKQAAGGPLPNEG